MKKKILFVDDDPGILMVSDMLLKSLGYEVLAAGSGQEAIDIIKNSESKIDFIFLDLMMPGLDGSDVLIFMRESRIKIPVVVQTGIMSDSDLNMVKNLGAIDCICKPYSKQDLRDAITKMVEFTASYPSPEK
jgi:CheY-like chemotaxis protein